MYSYWLKQGSAALFPDLLWARPETRASAGKLLIVGGTGQGFAAPAAAYAAALKAGIGTCRIMLPNVLAKTVSKLFPEAEFAPSTPSGSFALSALAELQAAAAWADGVMIAPDTGNNSETTRLFEAFLVPLQTNLKMSPVASARAHRASASDKASGGVRAETSGSDVLPEEERAPLLSIMETSSYDPFPITLCGDVIDTFLSNPNIILDRPNTTLVLTFEQLQKLSIAARNPEAFTSSMGLIKFVEYLHNFNIRHVAHLIVTYETTIAVAVDGQVSTTALHQGRTLTQVAASAATWWLQTPMEPFDAITTSLHPN